MRPGEKIHETLVSEEEANRTIERHGYYVIQPMLPELATGAKIERPLGREYSSADNVLSRDELTELLKRHNLLPGDHFGYEEELI